MRQRREVSRLPSGLPESHAHGEARGVEAQSTTRAGTSLRGQGRRLRGVSKLRHVIYNRSDTEAVPDQCDY